MSEESVVLAQLTDPTWHVLEIGPGGHPTPWRGPYTSIDHTRPGEVGNAGSEAGVHCRATDWGEMHDLPYQNRSFDALVARHVIEHHADTLLVLQEWERVLRPGGKLIIVTPDQLRHSGNTVHLDPTHVAAFTPYQLAALVRHAGFEAVQTAEAHPQWSFLLVATRI